MKVIFSANSFQHLYQLRLNIILHYKNKNYEVFLIAGDDDYRLKFEDLNVITKVVKIQPNGTSIFADTFLMYQYYLLFRNIRPNIIFNSTIKPNIFGGIVSRYLKIKAINNISGLGTTFLKSFLMKQFIIFLYRISHKNIFKVYFQNQSDLDLFKHLKIINQNQCRLIPGSGIDVKKFKRNNNYTPKKEIKYLFVGRLLKEKGLNELMLAIKNHLYNYNDTLKIAGHHDKKNPSSIDYEHFITECNNSSIKYMGYVENIRILMEEVDCLILPSYREGLSNVILEALSMEVPVLASNVPGCKELIEDGLNGYLFEPKNVESINACLEKFSNLSVEKKIKMGYEGREFVKNNYSIEKLINLYELDFS